MPIKKSAFAIRGMTRDTAVSKFSSDLAYENKNLRIILKQVYIESQLLLHKVTFHY